MERGFALPVARRLSLTVAQAKRSKQHTRPLPGRRLRRVLAEKKIAGVCAGFAEYFDMDVTLMRLLWLALLLIPPFPAVFIYIVAWIILPKE